MSNLQINIDEESYKYEILDALFPNDYCVVGCMGKYRKLDTFLVDIVVKKFKALGCNCKACSDYYIDSRPAIGFRNFGSDVDFTTPPGIKSYVARNDIDKYRVTNYSVYSPYIEFLEFIDIVKHIKT